MKLMSSSSVVRHVRTHWQVYACALAILFLTVLIKSCASRYSDWANNREINKHEAAAQKAEQEAAVSESKADDHRDQRIEAEKRIAARQPTLNERKREYDKSKVARPNPVSDADLDEREQRLLSKLKSLYPDN